MKIECSVDEFNQLFQRQPKSNISYEINASTDDVLPHYINSLARQLANFEKVCPLNGNVIIKADAFIPSDHSPKSASM